MDFLDDAQFRRMFRMDRTAFHVLESKLESFIGERSDTSVRKARNSSGSHIEMRTKLAVALRWLAGGSYLDICFAWGISKTSFYKIVWEILEAIDAVFVIGFPFNDNSKLQQIAAGFSKLSGGYLKNCVLAIDGWVCKVRQPLPSEVEFPSAY